MPKAIFYLLKGTIGFEGLWFRSSGFRFRGLKVEFGSLVVRSGCRVYGTF